MKNIYVGTIFMDRVGFTFVVINIAHISPDGRVDFSAVQLDGHAIGTFTSDDVYIIISE